MPRRDPIKNREYQAKWYAANRQLHVERIRKRRQEIWLWFAENKKLISCRKCGEDHPAAIDFHHNDPKKKEAALSQARRNGWSKKKLLAEIAKCTPLCATCHRIFHYEFDAGNITSLEEWLATSSGL